MKKAAILGLVLVVCLAMVGSAYAKWSDTVKVSGCVDTGEVCWGFASACILDSCRPPNGMCEYPTSNPDYTCNPGFVYDPDRHEYFWRLDKNVAWGEVEIIPDDCDKTPCCQPSHMLRVTLYNTYPCYFNLVSFYMHNYGTVPVKVEKAIIGGVEIYQSDAPPVEIDCTGEGDPDIEISWGDNFGHQYEPCCPDRSEYSFWIHVMQPAPQGQTLTFDIEVVACQWNEYQAP